MHEVGARHLDHLGAGLDHQVDRLLEPRQHAVLVALAAELLDDADPDTRQVPGRPLAGRADEVGQRLVDAGGVERVVAADHLVQQRRVEDGPGHRAGLVEGVGERDQAVARHPAVRRLHADRAGDGAGLADRPAGVGAERERRLERRDRGRRTRRRSRRGSGRGPTGCGSGRRPSARSRSPSRTRPCWSCRGSAGRPRAAGRPPSRRTAAPSPRGSGSRRWSAAPRWPSRP